MEMKGRGRQEEARKKEGRRTEGGPLSVGRCVSRAVGRGASPASSAQSREVGATVMFLCSLHR